MGNENSTLRLAVAALDGSLASEACLAPASEMCAQLAIPLYLVEVVTPVSKIISASMGLGFGYADFDTQKEIHNLRREAIVYLEQIKRHLRTGHPGLQVEITVLAGDPAQQIEEYTHKLHPVFVAMATHARGEFEQMLLGSVAEKVVRHSHQPVLLIRIPKGYMGYTLSLEEAKSGAATG